MKGKGGKNPWTERATGCPLQFQRLESNPEEMIQKIKLKDIRGYTKLVDGYKIQAIRISREENRSEVGYFRCSASSRPSLQRASPGIVILRIWRKIA